MKRLREILSEALAWVADAWWLLTVLMSRQGRDEWRRELGQEGEQ